MLPDGANIYKYSRAEGDIHKFVADTLLGPEGPELEFVDGRYSYLAKNDTTKEYVMVQTDVMETFENWVDTSVIADVIKDEFEEFHGRPPTFEEMKGIWLSILENLYTYVRARITDC